MIDLHDMGRRAQAAAVALARLSTEQKNAALLAIADALAAQTPAILEANRQDIADARAAVRTSCGSKTAWT
jgi:glutamate-5-semialdehyde dehydrogenase (EC 1.2.1.41)